VDLAVGAGTAAYMKRVVGAPGVTARDDAGHARA
jgi:hypothetical protein